MTDLEDISYKIGELKSIEQALVKMKNKTTHEDGAYHDLALASIRSMIKVNRRELELLK